MKLKIEINMDNSAFSDDNANDEINRILRKIADNNCFVVPSIGDSSKITDINGNSVGLWKISR